MVIKIAFFIPEWTTLELFLTALRPANALGPLEHLWQLQQLKWNPLAAFKLDKLSRLHIKGITKHYSVINVNDTVDPLWLRQHTHSLTCIQWWRRHLYDTTSGFEWLMQWKHFRLTAMTNVEHNNPHNDDSLLQPIDLLVIVDFTWEDLSLRDQFATALLSSTTIKSTSRYLALMRPILHSKDPVGMTTLKCLWTCTTLEDMALNQLLPVEELNLDEITRDLTSILTQPKREETFVEWL
ncbi:hypothetical protein LEN26_002666 [Aphanomyces euteiches]|nr:hypothetical protein LEN26_002666 [Aphanomyces euteiches]